MSDLHESTAFLAIGSNLGDRAAMLNRAIDSLRTIHGVTVVRVSTIIETEPVGLQGQGKFLNAAIMLRTTLGAVALLEVCLGIERAHGRVRTEQERWGPRVLDLDLLLFGELIINHIGPPRVVLPHPRMLERLFVLQPLAEIAPHVLHPMTGLTIQSHLERLNSSIDKEYPSHSACSLP